MYQRTAINSIHNFNVSSFFRSLTAIQIHTIIEIPYGMFIESSKKPLAICKAIKAKKYTDSSRLAPPAITDL